MDSLEISIHYTKCSYDELNEEIRKLTDAAKRATGGSYSPYSGFKVGAAVLLADNTIVTGCNQENIAYPSGLCAERTALFSAGATHPDTPVTAIAIAAFHNGEFTAEPVTPCGACRQVLAETQSRYGRQISVLLYGTEYCIFIKDGISALLPFSFSF
ncbi:MAG: cytidine deaminase [Bacteroidaceae bacterium]|nr:cytidine deaminase [Bacteroidaceae bacterium]